MLSRRIAAAFVAAVWLAPVAVAGGAALHVAFDHAHDGAAGSGEEHVSLAAVVEHGHAHAGETGDHEHLVISGAAVRAAAGAATAPPAVALGAHASPFAGGEARFAAAPPLAPPPRATGPPLLARLASLRL